MFLFEKTLAALRKDLVFCLLYAPYNSRRIYFLTLNKLYKTRIVNLFHIKVGGNMVILAYSVINSFPHSWVLIHQARELLHNLVVILSVRFGKISIFYSRKTFSKQYGFPKIFDVIFFRVCKELS